MKQIELKNKRKAREKHFLREDGTCVAYIYNDDVHYLKNGKYEEIDNTLITKNGKICNKASSFLVEFEENSKNGLMCVKKNNHYIKFDLQNSKSVTAQRKMVKSTVNQNIRYNKIFDDIDLDYQVKPSKIKEGIILKSKSALKSIISFDIMTDAELKLLDDGSIKATFNDDSFLIDAPYMIDSNGVICKKIFYNLTKNDDKYCLSFNLDLEWLENSNRKYPIYIDPTITVDQNNSVQDTYIFPNDTNVDRNSQDILKVGVERVNNNDIVNRALLKFDLPEIGTGSSVVSASLNLFRYPGLEDWDFYNYVNQYLTIHQVTVDWSENTANWSTMNDKYNNRIINWIYGSRSVNGYEISSEGCDITELVKKWYADTPNYGLMIKDINETYQNSLVPAFFSKDNAVVGNDSPKPYLEIVYKNFNGLENYMEYSSNDFDGGTSNVNIYNGNITLDFNLLGTESDKFPAMLKLYYNTNDVVLNNNYGYGKGYKLNFNQIIKEVLDENSVISYLEYCDEDGTLHYFKHNREYYNDEGEVCEEISNDIYYDESGSKRTIRKNLGNYELEDSSNNKMIFTPDNSCWKLSEICDNNENRIIINYTNGKISQIIDSDNNEINIYYENDKIRIVNSNEQITLNYLNSQLINIVDRYGTILFTYDLNDCINSIEDKSGCKLAYNYYMEKPYRVSDITEYGINNTIGGKIELFYGFNLTTIVDNNGRTSTYVFKYNGTLASVTDMKENDVINDSYGLDLLYGNFGQDNNKMLYKNNSFKWVDNLMEDSSFEHNNILFSSTTHIANLSVVSGGRNGGKCLKIDNGIGGNDIITKNQYVKKGKYYTFSAYFKTSSNCQMTLNAGTNSESVPIFASDEFNRYDVTVLYPTDNADEYGYLTINIEIGDSVCVYMDDMQLEEGKVANYYNLISNSDFSNGLVGWEIGASYANTGEICNENIASVVTLNNGKHALCINMNPTLNTGFSYEIPLAGLKGDKFNFSFWFKNAGINCFSSDGIGEQTNNVMVAFNYVNNEQGHQVFPSDALNPNESEWQFFSCMFEAEEDYESISITGWQNGNANNLYITNVGLYKDIRQENMGYNINGTLDTVYGYNDEQTKFKFDVNKQVVNIMNPEGMNFKIEYDNVDLSRTIKAISTKGITNENIYNNDNKPIINRIANYNSNLPLNTGMFRIRIKGTQKYLCSEEKNLVIANHKNCANLWIIIRDGDYFKINHSIISQLYITVKDNELVLSDYANDYSLFNIIENDNGSYTLKNKGSSLFVKVNNNISLSSSNDNSNMFELFFESSQNKKFLESDFKYTADGKFINSAFDNVLNKNEYVYDDVSGLLVEETNPKGIITKYYYNNLNQLILKKINKRNIEYKYSNGQLIEIKNGDRKYNMSYDSFLKLTTISMNNIPLVTNSYAPRNGNLLSVLYGNNDVIENEYDEFDRIKVLRTMDDEYTYEYGKSGQLLKLISYNDVKKYNYDLSNKISEIFTDGYHLKYKYDYNSNIVKKSLTNGFYSHIINSSYNEDGKLMNTTFESSGKYLPSLSTEVEYEYDYLGCLINKFIDDNYNISYEYITNGYRASKLIKSISNNNDKYSYSYDKLDNITHIYHNELLIAKYKYNDYKELIIEYDYINDRKVKYNYDNYGNMLEKDILNLTNNKLIQRIQYVYDNNSWNDQLTGYNGMSITYDEIGNMVTFGSQVFQWINGSQLISYRNGNLSCSFKYNDEGIRTRKGSTAYVLESNKIIIEKNDDYNIFYLYNEIDNLIGFVYNCGEQYDVYYYLKNAQFDIIGILDSNFDLVATYNYDAWGNILTIRDGNGNDVSGNSSHIANINPYRYRGYYYDRETNLYYLGTRYYSPELGRFVSCDVQLSDDANGNNLYVYCGNNPTSRIDIDGEFWWTVAKMVVGAACGLIGNGIVNVASGKNFFDGAVNATVGGAIGGLTFGMNSSLASAGVNLLANTASEVVDYIPSLSTGEPKKKLSFDNIKDSVLNIGLNTAVDIVLVNNNVTDKVRGAKPKKFLTSFTGKHAVKLCEKTAADAVVNNTFKVLSTPVEVNSSDKPKTTINIKTTDSSVIKSKIVTAINTAINNAINTIKNAISKLFK